VQVVHQQQEEYSGSLPHPDHLERFEALCPGITDRLMTTIEIEQRDANAAKAKQLELHEMGLQAHISDNKRSDFLALVALLACLTATVLCVHLGAFKVGGIIGGTTTVGVVGSILYGRVKALRRNAAKPEAKPKASK
jgi:uncharacterized membrane protein